MLIEILPSEQSTHPLTLESWNNLIDLYEAWGKPKEAEKRRAKLPQTETADE